MNNFSFTVRYSEHVKLYGRNKLKTSHKILITIKRTSIYQDNTNHQQGPDFDGISFFLCEIGDAIQYINFEYGAQAPKTVISSFCIVFKF